MKLRRRSVFDKAHQRTGLMMTPMVDVVLVILIFFMASTTIAGYEWFLVAGVEADRSEGDVEKARFALPAAAIEVDLVRGSDGVTMVYGLSGDSGVVLEFAVSFIWEFDIGDPESLRVVLGAGDDVAMGDVMAVHDAWNGVGVRVVMRTSR